MKPLVTTMFMAFLALVSSAAAWYFFPKVEQQQAEADRTQLLTEEEVFETRDIRKIKIERYDRASNNASEFELRFEDGRWVVPSRQGYLANNRDRIAKAALALRDKEVLDTVSDKKDDHEQYGVLDFSELGASRLGAGTVLTFEGRNRERLAKLIVGASPEGEPNQRYVRLAGQPKIYIVEFDSDVLTTNFSDWVDGNLFKIGGSQLAPAQYIQQLQSITVDLYYQDSTGVKSRKWTYRTKLSQTGSDWQQDIWVADNDQKLPDEPTLKDQGVSRAVLASMLSQLFNGSPLSDVTSKLESPAFDLAEPKKSQPASHFDSLKNFGFFYTGFEDDQHKFDSAGGKITIAYRYGMESTIYIGSPPSVDISSGGKINRFVMLTANMKPSLIPMPAKPGDQPIEEGAEARSQEDLERDYQTVLKQREQVLKSAEQLTKNYNEAHAGWVYMIPDEAIQLFFPSLAALKDAGN